MHEKKRYLKPELVQVPLRPEEAVLAACKSALGGGPSGTVCFGSGGCSGNGS